MMSTLKAVLVVEIRHSPAVMHNSLNVPHVSTNESLCPNALDHIQCQQKLQPFEFFFAQCKMNEILLDGCNFSVKIN